MTGLTVAVTGSDGFFGRAVVRALEANDAVDRVLALDVHAPLQPHPKTSWFKVDLVHPRSAEQLLKLLEGTQVLIHTAFLARPTHRGGWAHELETIGTRNVLAAVEAAGVRKLVLRSSTFCYGAKPNNSAYLPESAPLLGGRQSTFIADKVEAEAQVARYANKLPDRVVTVLRFAPLIGPTGDTLAANYLRQRVCPTLLGFDPLVQLIHEDDATAAAVQAAVHVDARGAVNVASRGVIPLSRAIKLAGRRELPIPGNVLRSASEALWAVQVGLFPPGLMDFLRYPHVGDLTLMQERLGFEPRLDVAATIEAFAEHTRRAPQA